MSNETHSEKGLREGLELAARQVENYYIPDKGEQLRTLAAIIRGLTATPAVREPGPTRYDLTVRPWTSSGGSTVHDEVVSYEAKDAREAIMALYASDEYDWGMWRLIDVRPAPAATEKGEGK